MHLRSSRKGWLGGTMGIALLFAAGVPVGLGQADLSDWPAVRIEVLALDAHADPIAGLVPDALGLKEAGQGQTIVEIKPDPEAQSVCLLIDSSGSMYDRRDSIRSAATRLLRSLPPEDEVCVADFSWKLYIDQDLTQNRQLDIAALKFIKASGGTRLRDSLMGLSDYMRGTAKHRSRAILLLSDGSDNASMSNEDEMKRRMEMGGGAVVHVMCVPAGPGQSAQRRSDTDQKTALHLAKTFGGLSYFPRDAADTDAAVDHLVHAMETRYILTYQAQDTARDGRERPIAVGFDKAHQNAKAVVRAPEGYYAPLQ
jgi:Ca-activated chloride channel homolog